MAKKIIKLLVIGGICCGLFAHQLFANNDKMLKQQPLNQTMVTQATGVITKISVTYMRQNQGGFRVWMKKDTSFCSSSESFAFINDTNSNYRKYVDMLLQAAKDGLTVTLTSVPSQGGCEIQSADIRYPMAGQRKGG